MFPPIQLGIVKTVAPCTGVANSEMQSFALSPHGSLIFFGVLEKA